MSNPTSQELKYNNDSLLVFLDETGHEAFSGDQPYYAVGGCAIMGGHYEWVKAKWKDLRNLVNGNPTAPLHAADLEYTKENLSAISQFFTDRAFARMAVAITNKTCFSRDVQAMVPVMGMLREHIARVVSLLPCSAVVLLFESSKRADPLVQKHFGELGLTENYSQTDIPVEHCFMPKYVDEPGLELADFIVSAAGTQARFRHRGNRGFAKDFEAVFHKFPPPFSQFFHIEDVEASMEKRELQVQGIRRSD